MAEPGAKNTLGQDIVLRLKADPEGMRRGLTEAGALISKFATGVVKFIGPAILFEPVTKAIQGTANAASVLGLSLNALATASTMTAARTQVLGTVVEMVGKNAGYTKKEIEGATKAIKDKGITAQESMTAVMRLTQSEIDLAKGTQLARVAQDLAVASGQNSSEAYATLIDAVSSLSPMLLRQFGLTKSLSDITEEYAKKNNLNANSLTAVQTKQAMLNYIMKEGEKVAGNYEAAMDDAGKKVGSFSRYMEDLRDEIGKHGLKIYKPIIDATEYFFKALLNLPPVIKDLAGAFVVFGGAVMTAASPITAVLLKLSNFGFIAGMVITGLKVVKAAIIKWAAEAALVIDAWLAQFGTSLSGIGTAISVGIKTIISDMIITVKAALMSIDVMVAETNLAIASGAGVTNALSIAWGKFATAVTAAKIASVDAAIATDVLTVASVKEAAAKTVSTKATNMATAANWLFHTSISAIGKTLVWIIDGLKGFVTVLKTTMGIAVANSTTMKQLFTLTMFSPEWWASLTAPMKTATASIVVNTTATNVNSTAKKAGIVSLKAYGSAMAFAASGIGGATGATAMLNTETALLQKNIATTITLQQAWTAVTGVLRGAMTALGNTFIWLTTTAGGWITIVLSALAWIWLQTQKMIAQDKEKQNEMKKEIALQKDRVKAYNDYGKALAENIELQKTGKLGEDALVHAARVEGITLERVKQDLINEKKARDDSTKAIEKHKKAYEDHLKALTEANKTQNSLEKPRLAKGLDDAERELELAKKNKAISEKRIADMEKLVVILEKVEGLQRQHAAAVELVNEKVSAGEATERQAMVARIGYLKETLMYMEMVGVVGKELAEKTRVQIAALERQLNAFDFTKKIEELNFMVQIGQKTTKDILAAEREQLDQERAMYNEKINANEMKLIDLYKAEDEYNKKVGTLTEEEVKKRQAGLDEITKLQDENAKNRILRDTILAEKERQNYLNAKKERLSDIEKERQVVQHSLAMGVIDKGEALKKEADLDEKAAKDKDLSREEQLAADRRAAISRREQKKYEMDQEKVQLDKSLSLNLIKQVDYNKKLDALYEKRKKAGLLSPDEIKEEEYQKALRKRQNMLDEAGKQSERFSRWLMNMELGYVDMTLLEEARKREFSLNEYLGLRKSKLQKNYDETRGLDNENTAAQLENMKKMESSYGSMIDNFTNLASGVVTANSNLAKSFQKDIFSANKQLYELERDFGEKREKAEIDRQEKALAKIKSWANQQIAADKNWANLHTKEIKQIGDMEEKLFNMKMSREERLQKKQMETLRQKMSAEEKIADYLFRMSHTEAQIAENELKKEIAEFEKVGVDKQRIMKYGEAKLKEIHKDTTKAIVDGNKQIAESYNDVGDAIKGVQSAGDKWYKTIEDFQSVGGFASAPGFGGGVNSKMGFLSGYGLSGYGFDKGLSGIGLGSLPNVEGLMGRKVPWQENENKTTAEYWKKRNEEDQKAINEARERREATGGIMDVVGPGGVRRAGARDGMGSSFEERLAGACEKGVAAGLSKSTINNNVKVEAQGENWKSSTTGNVSYSGKNK